MPGLRAANSRSEFSKYFAMNSNASCKNTSLSCCVNRLATRRLLDRTAVAAPTPDAGGGKGEGRSTPSVGPAPRARTAPLMAVVTAGKKRLAGDTARAATSDEVKDLRR